ncbi:hypothetical protein J4438_03250 [Candidatus Woesearchaeota archaeon]|nr:hypothetical protein [Candidatus Woesearchaeota archaeon]
MAKKTKKRKSILNWKWMKENFWNVVLIWLIWQIILAVIYGILTEVFKIQLQY